MRELIRNRWILAGAFILLLAVGFGVAGRSSSLQERLPLLPVLTFAAVSVLVFLIVIVSAIAISVPAKTHDGRAPTVLHKLLFSLVTGTISLTLLGSATLQFLDFSKTYGQANLPDKPPVVAEPRPEKLLVKAIQADVQDLVGGSEPAAPAGIPTIPHKIEGIDDCLTCHAAGGMKPVPASHAGRTTDICTQCHQPEDTVLTQEALPPPPPIPHRIVGIGDCLYCHGPSGIRPVPESHQGRTSDTCTICHEGGAESPFAFEAPPIIPHKIAGIEDCFTCHGESGVLPLSPTHDGRSTDSCALCHEPGQVRSSQVAVLIPPIPHPTSGIGDCLTCHGPSGLIPVPATHRGRTSDMCTLCHQGSTGPDTPPVTPPVIPHQTIGIGDCLTCHGPSGVVPVPASHAGRSSATCTSCHAGSQTDPPPVTVTAPAIPHSLAGMADCLACHGPTGLIPVPATHAGRTSATCTSCHSVAPAANQAQQVAAQASVSVPAIPHSLTGRADCLSCHSPTGLVPVPATHAGRTSATCTSCHAAAPASTQIQQVIGQAPVPAPAIPHEIAGKANCLACHSATSARPMPVSHDGRNNTTCTACHRPGTSQGSVDGATPPHGPRGECSNCHGANGSTTTTVNPPHGPRGECSNCHGSSGSTTTTNNPPHGPRGECSTCHGSNSTNSDEDDDQTPGQPNSGDTSRPRLGESAPHGASGDCSTCHKPSGKAPENKKPRATTPPRTSTPRPTRTPSRSNDD